MAATRRRGRRRRGRFGFLYKLFSVVLILGAIVGGCIVFFRVDEITVSGSTTYSDEEIIAAAGVERGDNLFLIGRGKAARRIWSQLPYINDANVRWALPDGLVINVTECVPVGVLQGEDGGWWVIDSGGKLLEQGGIALTGKYPRIDGLTALDPAVGTRLTVSREETAKLNSLKSLLAALAARDMEAQVGNIDLSGVSEIRMGYEGRFTVRLPMYSEDISFLIRTLQAAADYLGAERTGTIDLTGQQARFVPD